MHNAILKMLENNSRIDLHDLAVMMGTDEAVIVEEIEKMEKLIRNREVLQIVRRFISDYR